MLATQKQINFVNEIEKYTDIKYKGVYDFGSVSEFISKNYRAYSNALCDLRSETGWNDDLYDSIEERF